MSELVGPADLESAIIQAQTFRRAGDFDGATRTLSQLVLVAPDDPRVLGEYGKTLVAKGQTEDAIAFLNRAIELNPGDWTFYSAQGVAFDQIRNYATANVAYQRALALRPGEPSVLSNAGLSRMQAGDLTNAEILLNRAIEQGGTDPRIASNLAMLRELTEAPISTPAPTSPAPTAPGPIAEIQQEETGAAPIPGTIAREAISAPAPRTSEAVQALAADPTVFMQRIPDPDPVPVVIVAAPVGVTSDVDSAADIELEMTESDANEAEAGTTVTAEADSAPRALSEQVTAAADSQATTGLRPLVPAD